MYQPTYAQLQRVSRLIAANPHCHIKQAPDRKHAGRVRLRVTHSNGVSFKAILPDGRMVDITPHTYLRRTTA